MMFVSLLLNIVVLVPVTAILVLDASFVASAFGPSTPARGILLAIYLSILVGSVALVALNAFAPSPRWADMAAAMLVLQVLYKMTTPLTVGTLANPVVISNLAIAAVHCVTLVLWWRNAAPTAN